MSFHDHEVQEHIALFVRHSEVGTVDCGDVDHREHDSAEFVTVTEAVTEEAGERRWGVGFGLVVSGEVGLETFDVGCGYAGEQHPQHIPL